MFSSLFRRGNLKTVTERYPQIEEALEEQQLESIILDAEVVAVDGAVWLWLVLFWTFSCRVTQFASKAGVWGLRVWAVSGCGCVGVWVCGCVGVWVCGCVGVWVCGCVGVWVCGCVGVLWWGLPR